MIPSFDLKRQYESIRPEMDAAVARVLASGWFILGPEVTAFETEFARWLGLDHAIGVGSGTEAIHLALRALGVGPGDEVITVPNTAVATVAAIELAGAKAVLVDVLPDSMLMDPAQVPAAITPHTRAIIPVHLFGQAVDLDPILEVARAHNLFVLEDCAQAHGATYRGRKVGTLGHIAAFSFYPTKNLGAYGDGGAIATSDPAVAERVRLLQQYGWRTRYESEIKGVNSRLDEMQAAILRVKLAHLDAWNEARHARAALYTELLDGAVTPPREMAYGRPVYHLYVVQTPQREALAQHLKARGIGTAIQYPTPIHRQAAYQSLGGEGAYPVSERLAREILSLPLYPELTFDEVRSVAEAVRGWHSR